MDVGWLAACVDEDEASAHGADDFVRVDPARALRDVAFKRTLLVADLPEWVAVEMARVYETRPGDDEAIRDR